MTRHKNLGQIFLGPLMVAVLTAAGLISALIGDGPWDTFSWLSLSVPIALSMLFLWQRKAR